MGNYLKSIPKLSWLIAIFTPITVYMHFNHISGVPLFVVSALAILGCVTLIGKGVEEVSIYVGPLWGGLINATFANITELIIALAALKQGLYDIVRSSITGSILGNLLLVLGAAMVYGGTKYPQQTFTRHGASVNVGMLLVTLIILAVPSMAHYAYTADPSLANHPGLADTIARNTSLAGAVVLLSVYFLSLLFQLRTHRFLLAPDGAHTHNPDEAAWSKLTAVATLLGTTLVVAFLSEVFVDAINNILEVQKLQVSHLFVGVVVVAVVGNASEGMVAVWVARENKMDLSYQIAMGSCLQVGLMVAPLLVLASYAFNPANPMTLVFNIFELAALGAAVIIAWASLSDGESNWLEGVMMLAVYVFFAAVFWFHP